MLNILYEDEAVLVVWKPVGMESQSGRGFDADMVSEIKRYLSTKKAVDNHNLSTKPVISQSVVLWCMPKRKTLLRR